ncbi:23S rRNA (adenine(2503)-C(2))-methyltransferase RlmN, partial [Ureaplasma urealyticum]
LKEELFKLGLKSFISKQIYSWIYQKRIFNFDKFSNIAKNNVIILKENFSNNLLKINSYQSNSDGSIKFEFLTDKNLIINCMIIKFKNGFLIKINPFGINFKKEIINLSTNELVLQILLIQQFLDQRKLGNITNVIIKGLQDSLL